VFNHSSFTKQKNQFRRSLASFSTSYGNLVSETDMGSAFETISKQRNHGISLPTVKWTAELFRIFAQ